MWEVPGKIIERFPCYACAKHAKHTGTERILSNRAVFKTETPEDQTQYYCSLGQEESDLCSVVQLYRMFGSHRYSIIGNTITDKPLPLKE